MNAGGAIELLVEARPRDIAGFAVRRALPSMRRRMVGPFAFFDHMGPADLPLSVIAGTAYGERSPVGVLSPTLYVHAWIEAGKTFPVDDAHEERAVYVVEGAVRCEATPLQAGSLAVLRAGTSVQLTSEGPARVMLIGGARLAGERRIDWNFVSSSKERIEQARRDWKEGRFPRVPGDELDYVPLPERRS